MEEKRKTQVLYHANLIDSGVYDQVKLMSQSPAFKGLIAIMPDCHVGKGSCIGFTGKFNNCVIPNVVSVDIGCGVTAYPISDKEINFEVLDKAIRELVPLGFHSQKDEKYMQCLEPHQKKIVTDLCDKIVSDFYADTYRKYTNPRLQLGTLGGGNHFIEICENKNGKKWLVVHSGSRNLGQKVAMWYQGEAKKFHLKLPNNRPIRHLEWLPMDFGGTDYLNAMYLTQEYASWNRKVMIIGILKILGIRYGEDNVIESTHNYISKRDNIVRKGAISAHKDEKVIIPLNMAKGCIIGIGKGNSKYNFSAPHGAGRVYGRNVIKEKLRNGEFTMEQFEKEMEGVFSTCVNKGHIDESPMAYKTYEDIKENLEECVDIEEIILPIYNLKG